MIPEIDLVETRPGGDGCSSETCINHPSSIAVSPQPPICPDCGQPLTFDHTVPPALWRGRSVRWTHVATGRLECACQQCGEPSTTVFGRTEADGFHIRLLFCDPHAADYRREHLTVHRT